MDGNGNVVGLPFDPLDTLETVTGAAELLALQSSAGGPMWTRRSAAPSSPW